MTGVAARVGGRVIEVADVDRRLAALRDGPYAARLPHPATAEGRTLRRWVVQVLIGEAVIAHEAESLGVVADGAPSSVTLGDALRTGGVTAALLAAHPLARALRDRVAPPRAAPAGETLAFYHRNRDRYPQPFDEARDAIAATLAAVAAQRSFTRWFDERCAALVELAPGYEHPGDPRHPDATHRH